MRIVTIIVVSLFVRAGTAQTVCSRRQTPKQIDTRIDALIAKMSVPERIAQLQDRAPAVPSLGLPAYNWWNEGLHGIARNGYATVFPQAIGLAATWDASLLHAVGETVSIEARAKFNPHRGQDSPRYAGLTIWSPNVNIFRDPRWGRGQETYGEDPYLTGLLGTAFVKGLQGDDHFYLRADATPKHFVAHSGPEEGRDSFNAVVSAHDLEDTYLRAFHTLATKGHASALMCSYNAINGVPSCANNLLEQTVRDGWKFKGYIVSDCDAVGNLTGYQHYTSDTAHGAAAALNAGVDLDCGKSYLPLRSALATGLTTQAAIDRALHRLLLAKVHLGLLDPVGCSPYDRIAASDNDTPQHHALALSAAEESIVLLHNDGTLPLRPSQYIAVIGPNADSLAVLEANYHGTAAHPVTELAGLSETFPHLSYSQGSLLAEGVAATIPSTALRTSAGTDATPGLLAEYFNNIQFTGSPAISQTVPSIDFDLDRIAPSPGMKTKYYSARWSGYLVPPAPGSYILHVKTERCWDCTLHDHFRLFVDGNLALDSDGTSSEPNRYTLLASDTHPHAVLLELAHTGEDEGIALEWEPPKEALLDEAVRTAQNADVIIAIVGLSPDLEGEALHLNLKGFNGGDRTSLELPSTQVGLLERLQSLHKKLVVVLNSGSAVSVDPESYGASALLEAWYPGEDGGHALANILSGSSIPSGRLPITFYRSVADLPPFSDYSMSHRTYRYFAGPVLYPFGFGLSYGHIHYGRVHLKSAAIMAGQPLGAIVKLHNAGTSSASEVAELYLVPPQTGLESLPGAPRLALIGTTRVRLRPKQTRTLSFTLSAEQLSLVNSSGSRAVRHGTYRIFIGGSQPSPDQLANSFAGSTFKILRDQPINLSRNLASRPHRNTQPMRDLP
jgi:beta-glucosidase